MEGGQAGIYKYLKTQDYRPRIRAFCDYLIPHLEKKVKSR
jgi:hypothetical protein